MYDRWYIQAAVCRYDNDKTVIEFYWDWPDTSKVLHHIGEIFADPPTPGLFVGDAPWNPGSEVWNGILRGFQFYDVALTTAEIKKEISVPGSVHIPWYLNLNPMPGDISDHSGRGHHPAWVGAERPAVWNGMLTGGDIIRTTVPPR